ncbi:MAG: M28 family peptidase [Verrucomicrobia bacterium]|nr:M28 family peptidase [Verrucomicrobiota bacterium]
MVEFDGDNAYRILESIAYERFAATPGERKAAETLAGHVRGHGLEATLEEFRIWTYVDDEASVEVLTPYTKTYTGAVVGLSGATPPEGLECGFQYIEDGSSQYLVGVDGKAVLIGAYGVSYEKARELIDKGVAALITTGGNPHRLPNRKSWTEPRRLRVGKIPSLDLEFGDALELIREKASRVRVRIRQDEREGTSQNVVAEVRGTEFPDEVIVLVAHYDSISRSMGGHDNATGTAVMTEIMRCVAAEPLKRTVRLVLCGGEESGLHGSRAYAARHKDDLENFRLCINCDIAGAIFGNNSCFVTGPDSLRWYLDAMGKEFGMGYKVSTATYSSDNVPFSAAGIPACAITRGGGYCCEIHTSGDELDDVDGEHLAITGRYILTFLRRVGNAITFPFKREIADEMKKDLDRYVEGLHGTQYKPPKRLRPKAG